MPKFILVLALFCTCNAQADSGVSAYWRKAFGDGLLTLPPVAEVNAAEAAFTEELQGHGERAGWRALQMCRRVEQNLAVLSECDSARRGRGIFMLKTGAGVEDWLLQAPHAKFDQYTGDLAALLFNEAPFRAAQWNTVSRQAAVADRAEPADLAHLDGTYWQAFTRAFARQFPHGRIVQIHGFEQAKRDSKGAMHSDIIVSAGHARPPQWVRAAAVCLKSKMPGVVSLYPSEAGELGGTTNVQGQLLRSLRHDGFLHLEMSYSLRKLLLQRQDLRQALAACLKG